jgi:hypothetical protein
MRIAAAARANFASANLQRRGRKVELQKLSNGHLNASDVAPKCDALSASTGRAIERRIGLRTTWRPRREGVQRENEMMAGIVRKFALWVNGARSNSFSV